MKAQMKAVMASAVVIVLALAAVSGVTYSWFSDTEETDITVNTAVIDIDGRYSGVETHFADGTGTPDDTISTISSDSKDLEINNMMANRMVKATYGLSNHSTVNTEFRMYAVVDGLTDDLANASITFAGNNALLVANNVVDFNDGIGYIIGSSNAGVIMPSANTLEDYSFIITIVFEKNVTNVGNFSIRVVFEAYQTDYDYAPVQTISKGGVATLPTEAVTGDTTFKGAVPAVSGAVPAEAEVVFSKDAMNTITNDGGDVVKLQMLMLDSGDDIAKLKITLDGSQTTNFNADVTITLKIPGEKTGVQVIYNGDGEQPTVLDVSYDSLSGMTSITFVTNHFSEYVIVDKNSLVGNVARYGNTNYDSLIDALDDYESEKDDPLFIIDNGTLIPTSVIADIDGLKEAAQNGGTYLTRGIEFSATNGEGNALVKFTSNKDVIIIGVTEDDSDAVFDFDNMEKSSSSGGTLTIPTGMNAEVKFENIQFDFDYIDTGAWHTRSVHANDGTLVLNDCSFTGNNVGIAVNLSGTADAIIESCKFDGSGGVNTAIYARGSGNIQILDCEFKGYPIGINIDATTETTSISIKDNEFNLGVTTAIQENAMTADHNGRAIAIAWNVRTATYDNAHFSVVNNVFVSDGEDVGFTVLSMGSGSYDDAKKYYTSNNANFIRNLFVNETDKGLKYSYRAEWSNSEYVFDTLDQAVILKDENVRDAEGLVKALENGRPASLSNDIIIDPANMSNAYGTTGINVKYGQTIDGKGHTLDIKGAGGTWDSGINTTGGLIKDLTVTGSFRGIFINHNSTHSETVVLENVIIDGTTYTISCDQGLNQNFEATKSTFKGWTSYAATLGSAKFTDCYFGEGNGYSYCRPYASTTFIDCEFEAGFKIDPRAAVTFENCTVDGVALTSENLSTLVTNTDNATIKC